LPDKCQKMDSTEKNKSAVGHSEDSDQDQFDKLFTELVAESTAGDDPKIADAMKWFKRASIFYLHEMYEKFVVMRR